MSGETILLIVSGIVALILVPPFLISLHGWRERRHHRRMGQRRTDRIDL